MGRRVDEFSGVNPLAPNFPKICPLNPDPTALHFPFNDLYLLFPVHSLFSNNKFVFGCLFLFVCFVFILFCLFFSDWKYMQMSNEIGGVWDKIFSIKYFLAIAFLASFLIKCVFSFHFLLRVPLEITLYICFCFVLFVCFQVSGIKQILETETFVLLSIGLFHFLLCFTGNDGRISLVSYFSF